MAPLVAHVELALQTSAIVELQHRVRVLMSVENLLAVDVGGGLVSRLVGEAVQLGTAVAAWDDAIVESHPWWSQVTVFWSKLVRLETQLVLAAWAATSALPPRSPLTEEDVMRKVLVLTHPQWPVGSSSLFWRR